jgi:hypothetical protein
VAKTAGDRGEERDWTNLSKGEEPPREWVREQLWAPSLSAESYKAADAYLGAVLEQYKVYVEMADRISARRGLTNTFFLTLNSAIFTVIGVFWKDRPPEPTVPALLVLLAVALAQCAAWFFIVRSYRQLNSAKYDVVGLLEEKLPASPYWGAEWARLKHGDDWRVYWPLTHIEQWVPILFGLIYIAGAGLVVVS